MKKVMFLMAVCGMFAFASCNNAPAEEPVDSTAIEVVEEEIVVDTNAVEAAAETVEAEAVVAE